MKTFILVTVSLLVGVVGGYFAARSSHQKELYQQELESDLTSSKILMSTLQALDSGDVKKSRQIAMTSVHMHLAFLPDWAKRGKATTEQRQHLVELARATLDYMLAHRDEWDPRLPSVRTGLRGLGKVLLDTNDLRRFSELTNHLANAEMDKR